MRPACGQAAKMTMDKCMCALSHQINSIRQSQGFSEAVICIVSPEMPTMQTINFLTSPLSHWGHKRRPPGSKRAPASRKAWCPPQAATKRRTFHGGGWKPNQTIKISEKHSNMKPFRTSQQPAFQHLDVISCFGCGDPTCLT